MEEVNFIEIVKSLGNYIKCLVNEIYLQNVQKLERFINNKWIVQLSEVFMCSCPAVYGSDQKHIFKSESLEDFQLISIDYRNVLIIPNINNKFHIRALCVSLGSVRIWLESFRINQVLWPHQIIIVTSFRFDCHSHYFFIFLLLSTWRFPSRKKKATKHVSDQWMCSIERQICLSRALRQW